MIALRVIAVTLAVMWSASGAMAQERTHYRDFRLGGNLASVAALSGAAASEARTIHERPALMQELEWRPSYFVAGTTTAQTDPVQRIVFCFYEDQLSRLVIDYDRQRTEGMTDSDMIEALSSVYGPALIGKKPAAATPLGQESGTAIARWKQDDTAVVLYRISYASGFRLIVSSASLDALARAADARAVRLDERDAPRTEMARQRKEADSARVLQQKLRLANKAAFKP